MIIQHILLCVESTPSNRTATIFFQLKQLTLFLRKIKLTFDIILVKIAKTNAHVEKKKSKDLSSSNYTDRNNFFFLNYEHRHSFYALDIRNRSCSNI